jgi:DNA replicative helicase MCM subunit Mcm2 (Cdc46/Mcm family)
LARRDSSQGADTINVRALGDELLEQKIRVLARVADTETKKISIQVAVFRCSRCGRIGEEVQTTQQLKFPLECSPSWGGCGARRREAHFRLLEKESLYTQEQKVVLADNEKENRKIHALLRGPLADSLPIGAQAVFRGRLKRRRGKLPRGELPFTLEVDEVTDTKMPEHNVVYPRKIDAQMIYNIVIELQRRGDPTSFRVVVDEARKIGLAEEDVRAMLNKLLSEGKLEGKEREGKRLRGPAEGDEPPRGR